MLNSSPQGRTNIIEQGPGFSRAEFTAPIVYEDGFKICVWWDEEPADSPHAPGYWCAELNGTTAEDHPLGTGATPQEALLSLCCSLAALANALDNTRDDPA